MKKIISMDYKSEIASLDLPLHDPLQQYVNSALTLNWNNHGP